MTQFIEGVFELAAVLFNKIPALNKLSGYRSIIGFVGLGVVQFLSAKAVITDPTILSTLNVGLIAWTGLSLNAKGRPTE